MKFSTHYKGEAVCTMPLRFIQDKGGGKKKKKIYIYIYISIISRPWYWMEMSDQLLKTEEKRPWYPLGRRLGVR
jgi:hypothetical protein